MAYFGQRIEYLFNGKKNLSLIIIEVFFFSPPSKRLVYKFDHIRVILFVSLLHCNIAICQGIKKSV